MFVNNQHTPLCAVLNRETRSVHEKRDFMKTAGVDRRIERTKQLLHEALLSLILEKGYEAITVQDILDRANLGRSTFYSHYQNKDALLQTGFDHLQAMLEERHRSLAASRKTGAETHFNLTLELFRHAQENHLLYKAIVGKQSGQIIMQAAHSSLSDLIRKHLASILKPEMKTAVPAKVAVHWIASSFLTLITWWLDNNLPYSAEEMDRIFRTVTFPGIEAGLGITVS